MQESNSVPHRRGYKKLVLTEQMWFSLFQKGVHILEETGFPKDTRIISVTHNIERGEITFLFESAWYPLIPEGGVAPALIVEDRITYFVE